MIIQVTPILPSTATMKEILTNSFLVPSSAQNKDLH